MIKKIITFLLAMSLLLGISSLNAAGQEFTLTNNKGTIEVTPESIFVGDVEKNTSIIDLFKSINIDGKSVIEDTLKVLDVRYVTPEQIDYKISSDTDIIDTGSTVYVLFKNAENGGLINNTSTVDFELKNFKFKEIGTISDLAENSYTKVYDVVNVEKDEQEDIIVTNEEAPVIDNVILEENNTGIKDNIIYILLSIIILLGLFMFPNTKQINLK